MGAQCSRMHLDSCAEIRYIFGGFADALLVPHPNLSLSLPRKGKGTQPDTYVYYICAQLFKSELARK